jgi:beta-mannosidase
MLKKYVGNYFQPPKDFLSYAYTTQVLQAYSLETAITSLRTAKPYNMGSLYWQLNDLWPVFSWATVDSLGCWKAGHYTARKNHFDPVLTIKETADPETFELYIISDIPDQVTGNLLVRWITLDGNVAGSFPLDDVRADSTKAKLLITLRLPGLVTSKGKSFLHLE